MNRTANTILVLAMCLSLSAVWWPLTAAAQEAKADGVAPWTYACEAVGIEAPLRCRMTQEFFSKENRQRVIALTVTLGETGAPELTLALPHGPLLPPGLALKVDEQDAVVVPIESSNAAGVFARVPLEGELGNAIRRGNTLSVGVTNRAGKLVQVPVSLAGFSAAFKRLTAIK